MKFWLPAARVAAILSGCVRDSAPAERDLVLIKLPFLYMIRGLLKPPQHTYGLYGLLQTVKLCGTLKHLILHVLLKDEVIVAQTRKISSLKLCTHTTA